MRLYVHNCKSEGRQRTCGVVCQVRYLQAAPGAIRQLHLIVLVGTLQHSELQLAACKEGWLSGIGADGMTLTTSGLS